MERRRRGAGRRQFCHRPPHKFEPFLEKDGFPRGRSARRGGDAGSLRRRRIIFHEGALPSVPRSVKEPAPSHDANINGTFTLLEAARAAGVRRIIYAASSSAYGNQPGMPRRESMTPASISPYAVQKLTGELYMKSYWQVYGMETACLRYFNIFGPRQAPDSPYSGVMAKFILQMMRGETADDLRDRRAGARLYLHCECSVGESAGGGSSKREDRRQDVQCGVRGTTHAERDLRDTGAAARVSASARVRAAASGRHHGFGGGHLGGARGFRLRADGGI